MTPLDRSQALHQRVRAFARSPGSEAEFEQLALDIARFQCSTIPGCAALARAHGSTLETLSGIPLVPAEAFRVSRLCAFGPEVAPVCFETSGTTAANTGRHYFRTLETYRELCIRQGRSALLGSQNAIGERGLIVVALMPDGGEHATSSLNYMVQRFMEAFDGHSLDAHRSRSRFSVREPGRWLVRGRGVDRLGLTLACDVAARVDASVLLLTTSFALLTLLDELGNQTLPLPPGSIVMPTGGFKGRTREVAPEAMRRGIEQQLGAPRVVSEYGMTELSSQLYAGPEPASPAQGHDVGAASPLYLEPPWLRVVPVDPATLAPVPDGEVGLASFYDLANVDSCVRVLTRDRVVRQGSGIRLLGRSARAPLRGCSLAAEEFTLGGTTQYALGGDIAPTPPTERTSPSIRQADADALDRVRRLVSGAGRLANPESPGYVGLIGRLAASTGLSSQGVEAALEHCLETHPSPAELAKLCAGAPTAEVAWVVLSANVFTAAHRAIALALACAPRVRVRCSTRESGLARALHEQLPGLFEIVEQIAPLAGEHLFVYGADGTLKSLQQQIPAGVVVHAHGSGFGVGWIAQDADLGAAARGLARDVALFDQRGCLSPRLVVLEDGVPFDVMLGELQQALEQVHQALPPGTSAPEAMADVRQFHDVALLSGARVLRAGEGWVAGQPAAEVLLLPPTGRNLFVLSGERAGEQLGAQQAWVTTLAVAGGAAARRRVQQLFPYARVCRPGDMQRPPFDGPVDVRPGTWIERRAQ